MHRFSPLFHNCRLGRLGPMLGSVAVTLSNGRKDRCHIAGAFVEATRYTERGAVARSPLMASVGCHPLAPLPFLKIRAPNPPQTDTHSLSTGHSRMYRSKVAGSSSCKPMSRPKTQTSPRTTRRPVYTAPSARHRLGPVSESAKAAGREKPAETLPTRLRMDLTQFAKQGSCARRSW